MGDETDRMIEKGHFAEMQNLLEVINNAESKNKRRQTFVFSATLSLIHELPKHVAGKKGAKKTYIRRKVERIDEYGWGQVQTQNCRFDAKDWNSGNTDRIEDQL